MLPTVQITHGGLETSKPGNPIIINRRPMGKKNMHLADLALGIFRSLVPDLCVPGRGILRPQEPWYVYKYVKSLNETHEY